MQVGFITVLVLAKRRLRSTFGKGICGSVLLFRLPRLGN